MNNYSKQESGEDYELVNKIVENEYRIIDNIEVKIKPRSFESNKEKNASVQTSPRFKRRLCFWLGLPIEDK